MTIKQKYRNKTVLGFVSLCFAFSFYGTASAISYHVTIDSAALNGATAQLALDFIDGGPPSNSITISNFSIIGLLTSQTTSGSVTGALPNPVGLTDGSFFNELLADLSIGLSIVGTPQIAFDFDPTTNAPSGASLPDSFSVFLLNPVTGLSLFGTTDPTGADALFQFDIDGTNTGALSRYSATNAGFKLAVTPVISPPPSTGVPEPTSLFMLLLGVLFCGGSIRLRGSSCKNIF